MAWDEWEQLKADAVQRHTTNMRINSASADGGYAEAASGPAAIGDLKSEKAAWVAAAEGVADQRKRLGKALTALTTGQKGIGENEGCKTAAVQSTVHTSWHTYAKTLDEKCQGLQQILEKTGHEFHATDESVKDELNKLKTKYQDTPAAGGQAEGR
ncbi:hypothetical protein [Streptomyces sp. NBC_00893]|uniref:hypothetical protein n=1 Tax=Streptomyces sp. NBC_00893 TaxID=2975862 RepID=UPI00224C9DE5|nr:hypothetical protein [Streptomyces sp. NBC_00893]MCX4846081.1 hypothetical protein [Streptomyces sp. NBC_00893]